MQAGVEFWLGPSLGLLVDMEKTFLKTTGTGTRRAAGGGPMCARSPLDTVVMHAGLHFSS